MPRPMGDFKELNIGELNVNKVSRPKRRIPNGYAAVAATGILILGTGVPVIAQIPFVSERMGNMSVSEKEELAGFVDEVNWLRADLYSRPMTAEEKKRKIRLRQEYGEGRFPEGSMTVITQGEETEEEFYYNESTGMFYLPQERELSDEELRQMIDFDQKRDYALQDRAKQYVVGEGQNKTTADNEQMESAVLGDMPDGAIGKRHEERLKNWLQEFYTVSFNRENMKLTECEEVRTDSGLCTRYKYGYTDWDTEYEVAFFDGTLTYMEKKETDATNTETDISVPDSVPLQDTQLFRHTVSALENALENGTVKKAWYSYKENQDGTLKDGGFSYIFEAEVKGKAEGWICNYKYGETSPCLMMQIDLKGYLASIENAKEWIAEKYGFVDKMTELDLETGESVEHK